MSLSNNKLCNVSNDSFSHDNFAYVVFNHLLNE